MNADREQELLSAARAAADRAWAPYSKYRVGAAVLTASGEIVTGCNVENVSYGLSMCAERVAVFSAREKGLVDPISAPLAAVAVYSPGPSSPWPCGACRQVLREFGGDDLPVWVDSPEGTARTTLGELLPRPFTLEME
ncbi:MAG: cytidine deaminase [Gemmatimonadota bacterium]|jgi:cytidine deaminase|nr:cytidine deaminase [Gemmatimonadota bacterium]MDP6528412.1 cytidine deaminase [Gemmatimonadota bacterium]MDP6803471.1 cytidine deaminase [Gemmatimonadota bacterium]MDP7032593.1 cytidine deaminase [Gemmatimonadota bacterium]